MIESRLWALVPVKRFAAAKSRLRPALDGGECAELAQRMLEDVLSTLTACPEILSGVLVVSAEETALETARRFAARAIRQAADTGINDAILHALKTIGSDDGMIVVPSDIPQLSRDAITQTAAAIAIPNSMAIARAAEDGGTNLIACCPARLFSPCFGADSFEEHRRTAVEAGLDVRILDLPELALDIDRPWHLEKFLAMRTNTRTHAFLSRRVFAEVTS